MEQKKREESSRHRLLHLLTELMMVVMDDLEHSVEEDHGHGVHSKVDIDTKHSNREITTAEILKMYESG